MSGTLGRPDGCPFFGGAGTGPGGQLDKTNLVTHLGADRLGRGFRSGFSLNWRFVCCARFSGCRLRRTDWQRFRQGLHGPGRWCGRFRRSGSRDNRSWLSRRFGYYDDRGGLEGRRRGRRRLGLLNACCELFFEKFRGDFVERAGGNLTGGYAQLLGLGQDLLVFQTKFLCYVVNTNGHKSNILSAGGATRSSCS